MNENNIPWSQPGWHALAYEWIRTELKRCAIPIMGEIEQPHFRPWSTVLTVKTAEGLVFFKATAPCFGHETALTAFLSGFAPQNIPQLLAVDLDRRWMLMRDSGTPLRKFIRRTRSVQRWQKVLPIFAGLQKGMASHQAELLGMGVFDRRLAVLPGLFARLISDESAMQLDQEDSLTTAEYQRLGAFIPGFTSMCARLAVSGVPETLHHDDFHDGNIFIQDESIIFTDWGESAVSHPFFTLVVMLRGLENSLDLQPDAAELDTLRDWYLSQWSEYGTVTGLRPVARLAEQVGLVNRALTWHNLISQLPESLRNEYAIAVPSYLKDFINSIEP